MEATSRNVIEFMQNLEGRKTYSETMRREGFDSRLGIAILVGIAIIVAWFWFK